MFPVNAMLYDFTHESVSDNKDFLRRSISRTISRLLNNFDMSRKDICAMTSATDKRIVELLFQIGDEPTLRESASLYAAHIALCHYKLNAIHRRS